MKRIIFGAIILATVMAVGLRRNLADENGQPTANAAAEKPAIIVGLDIVILPGNEWDLPGQPKEQATKEMMGNELHFGSQMDAKEWSQSLDQLDKQTKAVVYSIRQQVTPTSEAGRFTFNPFPYTAHGGPRLSFELRAVGGSFAISVKSSGKDEYRYYDSYLIPKGTSLALVSEGTERTFLWVWTALESAEPLKPPTPERAYRNEQYLIRRQTGRSTSTVYDNAFRPPENETEHKTQFGWPVPHSLKSATTDVPAVEPVDVVHIQKVHPKTGPIILAEKETRVLEHPVRIVTVKGFKGQVISVRPRSATRIQLQGINAGVSDLVLVDETGASRKLMIVVEHDVRPIQYIVDRLYPESNIKVIPLTAKCVVLRGTVNDAQDHEDVLELVNQFVDEVQDQLTIKTGTADEKKDAPGPAPSVGTIDSTEIPHGYRAVSIRAKIEAGGALVPGMTVDITLQDGNSGAIAIATGVRLLAIRPAPSGIQDDRRYVVLVDNATANSLTDAPRSESVYRLTPFANVPAKLLPQPLPIPFVPAVSTVGDHLVKPQVSLTSPVAAIRQQLAAIESEFTGDEDEELAVIVHIASLHLLNRPATHDEILQWRDIAVRNANNDKFDSFESFVNHLGDKRERLSAPVDAESIRRRLPAALNETRLFDENKSAIFAANNGGGFPRLQRAADSLVVVAEFLKLEGNQRERFLTISFYEQVAQAMMSMPSSALTPQAVTKTSADLRKDLTLWKPLPDDEKRDILRRHETEGLQGLDTHLGILASLGWQQFAATIRTRLDLDSRKRATLKGGIFPASGTDTPGPDAPNRLEDEVKSLQQDIQRLIEILEAREQKKRASGAAAGQPATTSGKSLSAKSDQT